MMDLIPSHVFFMLLLFILMMDLITSYVFFMLLLFILMMDLIPSYVIFMLLLLTSKNSLKYFCLDFLSSLFTLFLNRLYNLLFS